MVELNYNNFVSLITRYFQTVVSSLYIKDHSLVSRVSLMFKKLLFSDTNFRNGVYKQGHCVVKFFPDLVMKITVKP